MHTVDSDFNFIRIEFPRLASKADLLTLINNTLSTSYGDHFKPIPLKSLTYFTNPELAENRYSRFEISKKSGGKRIINAPQKGLKLILKTLNIIFKEITEAHPSAMGFVSKKSIVDNAAFHVGKKYVYNIDLKDFFHSFNRNRLKMALMNEPFNLYGNKEPLAFFIACLCTHPIEINGQIKHVLPQGSPCSPTLTNILCITLDRRLTGLAKRFGVVYSRYADDITFSADHSVFNKPEFLLELRRLIVDQGFEINQKKVRLQKEGYKKEVTGLIVNEKINVPVKYIKQLRMWLYLWEKYGYVKAEEIFKKDYFKSNRNIKKGNPNMINVLEGKLLYLKMVKGPHDSTLTKLEKRFHKLCGGKEYVKVHNALTYAFTNIKSYEGNTSDFCALRLHQSLASLKK